MRFREATPCLVPKFLYQEGEFLALSGVSVVLALLA